MDAILAVGTAVCVVLAIDGRQSLVVANGNFGQVVAAVALENGSCGQGRSQVRRGVSVGERRGNFGLFKGALGVCLGSECQSALHELQFVTQTVDGFGASSVLFVFVLPEHLVATLVTGPVLVEVADDGLHFGDIECLVGALARVVVHVGACAAGPQPMHGESRSVHFQGAGPLLHEEKVIEAGVIRGAAARIFDGAVLRHSAQGLRGRGLDHCGKRKLLDNAGHG